MKSIVRKNDEAVSPVIATILMVAITVVLAAVLYVMVSGLITPTGTGPKQIGATITRSSDGANWIITFTTVPTGLNAGTTTLSIRYPSGVVDVSNFALSTTGNGTISYNPAAGGTPTSTTTLAAADTILLSTMVYKSGYQVTLTASGSIVYGPQTLQ